MTLVKLVRFDRPVRDAGLGGRNGRFYSEAEIASLEEAAFQRGAQAAAASAEEQVGNVRREAAVLAQGVLKRLAETESQMVEQVRDGIPALALDLAKRLLAGYEPPADVVSRLCEEALGGVFPQRDNLELSLSTRDAAALDALQPEWLQRYPGLRIRTDAALRPGDCQVRSRFGLTDARLEAKLIALEQSLAPS